MVPSHRRAPLLSGTAVALLALLAACSGTDFVDAGAGADGGTSAHRVRPGCAADGGIECDGDWADSCLPACAPTQCCSPQDGEFRCVDPDPDGYCPAPDLSVDERPIAERYRVEWAYFPADDCALVERCVDAPGWRRLLRFDTWTPNSGSADLFLGRPSPNNPWFQYSTCHQHYHFVTYADYALLAADGSTAAVGHKQAFCLEDYFRAPWDGVQAPMSGGHYDCTNRQGISRGWQDVYGQYLACQWIDVTAVAAGRYTLRVSLNTAHALLEQDYDNNTAAVPVDVPPSDAAADPTQPCVASSSSANRQCGWTREGVHPCTPGAAVSVGCDAACGLGACTGDTVLRAYEGDRSGAAGNWSIEAVLASDDDADCGAPACGSGAGGDCCSRVRFACPSSGVYTVLWAPLRSDGAASCQIAVSP